MHFGELIPIIAIMATAWVMVTYLNHHYRGVRRGQSGDGAAGIEDVRENARLAHENEVLKLTVDRLEERLSVLERIATDPAERTAREIERLR